MPLESRELIFPNTNVGDDLDYLGRKQIHDVSRADFRGPKVEAHATAVSKVAIALTTRYRDNCSAQATKGVHVLDGWQRTLKETDWTHCSDLSARLGLCSHMPGAQVVADI